MANERARQLRKTMTPHEVRLWLALRQLRPQGLHFRRQVPRCGYILDFACLKARLAVEVDGERHGFESHLRSDEARDAVMAGSGFLTLRFWNHEILQNLDGVVETIISHATQRLDPTSHTSGSLSG